MASRPDRQSSIARATALGPQISLPCTAPVTSSFGPGCKPVKQMVSIALLPTSIVMIDVDYHAGDEPARQFQQVVAAERHATRRPAHVRACGVNEQRAAAARFGNGIVV